MEITGVKAGFEEKSGYTVSENSGKGMDLEPEGRNERLWRGR